MKTQVELFDKKNIVKTRKKKNLKKEENLQLAISKYIRMQYPAAIFNCDLASGMKLPIWIAGKAKSQRSSKGQPDLIILEPRDKYHGLCLELKKDMDSVYLKDGVTLKKSEHLQEQQQILCRLSDKGYCAQFSCGFDNTKMIIDWYFSL